MENKRNMKENTCESVKIMTTERTLRKILAYGRQETKKKIPKLSKFSSELEIPI
jgi:hypothetical protein